MSRPFPVIIHHNPRCGTSRSVVAAVEAAGLQPTLVAYLETGWSEPQLLALLAAMDAAPRDILREKEALAADLGLPDPQTSDRAILQAMVEHPILVNRPIVVTPKGVKLCRPAETVQSLLPGAPAAT